MGAGQRNEELTSIEQGITKANTTLHSINAEAATTKRTSRKQKQQLKAGLERYLKDNKLTWQKIRLAQAILDDGLLHALSVPGQKEELRQRIISAGSLVKVTKQLEHARDKLQTNIDNLSIYEQHYYKKAHEAIRASQEAENSLLHQKEAINKLDAELMTKKAGLAEVIEETSEKIENLYISHLIIDFLFDQSRLNNRDLDRFIYMLTHLSKKLGVGHAEGTGTNEGSTGQYQAPAITTDLEQYRVDINHAREAFAHLLSPLVRDKFVTKHEYEIAKMQHEFSEKLARMEGIVEERNRYRNKIVI